MPFDSEPTEALAIASGDAIAKVRALDAKAVSLNAHMRQPDVAALRKRLYGFDAPAPVRHATQAEIFAEAARLDAGHPLNPRLWMERMTVGGAQ